MLSYGVVDKIGRRPLILISYIGSSCSLAVVGFCYFIQEVIAIKDYATIFGNIIFSGILCFCIMSTIGYDMLTFVIPAEIFPLNVKTIAMVSVNLYGGIVVFCIVKGYQIINDLTGYSGVFWFYGSMCLAGAIFSYCLVPETRGKSLRDIQMELQGSLYEECVNVDLNRLDNVESSLLNEKQEGKDKLNSNTKDF